MNRHHNEPSPYIISFLTLRKAIGLLGVSLPALLLLGTFIIGRCTQVQNSISHYYYTIMGDLFVGVMCSVAMFLISYKGYNKTDNWASTFAGLFALVTAFFATTNDPDINCAIRQLPELQWRTIIHYAAAACFFLTLALISIFLFTKSEGRMTKRKKIRNAIYRTCGFVMIGCIFLIALFKLIPWMQTHLAQYKPVFWLEWLALIAFGTSWLIKGKTLFQDK